MTRSSLFLIALIVAILLVGTVVEARSARHRQVHKPHHHHGNYTFGNAAPNHPTVMDAETVAFYAKINLELAARNFSRPKAPADGAYGVDISAWAGQDTWSCLVQNGYSFAIVREYQETCAVDPNGVHSVANAWAAGVSHVDIYLYPSYTCGWDAASQVDQTIDSMGSIPFGQLWFDIESEGAADPTTDYNWLQAAVNQAVSRLGGSRVGIYSSAYGWSVAMGDYANFYSFPIWYAHYDNNPSFSDWTDFAGWTSPAMKQYAGDATPCGFDVDLNWY